MPNFDLNLQRKIISTKKHILPCQQINVNFIIKIDKYIYFAYKPIINKLWNKAAASSFNTVCFLAKIKKILANLGQHFRCKEVKAYYNGRRYNISWFKITKLLYIAMQFPMNRDDLISIDWSNHLCFYSLQNLALKILPIKTNLF